MHKFSRIILIFISLMLFVSACKNQENKVVKKSQLSEVKNVSSVIKSSTDLDLQTAKEDLEAFRTRCLCTHYGLIYEDELRTEFENKYNEVINELKEPITKYELYFEISKLLNVLNDGHAFVFYPDETKYIPVNFNWLEEGLIVTDSKVTAIEKGDKIISIGYRKMDEIFKDVDDITSAENIYWVRVAGLKHLRSECGLKWLKCLNEDGTINMQVEKSDGSIQDIKVEFYEYDRYPWYHYDEDFISYRGYEENNITVLDFRKCINNDEYKETLKSFFDYVEEKNITNIIVDLSQNTGGNSNVIEEFMSYLNIDEYNTFFGEYNGGTPYRAKSKIKNQTKDRKLYDGNIYVATSNRTFSSAVLFTGVLKYNDIATTIGEPVGNATIRFGYRSDHHLPYSKIKYSLCINKWHLPNVEYLDTIEPDVYIPLKQEHIRNEINPIEEWIEVNFNNDKM